MDVRIIGCDIGLPGCFVAHVKMKAPGVTAQKRAGEKAPGKPLQYGVAVKSDSLSMCYHCIMQ